MTGLLMAVAMQAVVSGTTPVTTHATDNVGVVKIEYFLDGQFITEVDHPAPGVPVSDDTIDWDTLPYANGQHSLTARATDAAGNATLAAPVAVDIQNADVTPPTVVITEP